MSATLVIFRQFLLLGCTSFGGPSAHIGYFRQCFVRQHKWLSEQQFAHTLALCQLLPGPGSSQLGFAIGYQRAGLSGALAAFIGFTLPSFVLMFALGLSGSSLLSTAQWAPLLHLLKLVAVVVVADAVIGMYAHFCNTRGRRALTVCFALLFLLSDLQLSLLLLAAIAGAIWFVPPVATDSLVQSAADTEPRPRWRWLLGFIVLALAAVILSTLSAPEALTLGAGFAEVGSWVFGGGHVVLPMLQDQFPQLDNSSFLAGYAAAQALPGPLFSLAAFVGTQVFSNPFIGALVATLAIFAPGFCLLLAFIDSWQVLLRRQRVAAAIAAVNCAVVALLAAALWHPIISSSVYSLADLGLVALGLTLLRYFKCSPSLLLLTFFALGLIRVLW